MSNAKLANSTRKTVARQLPEDTIPESTVLRKDVKIVDKSNSWLGFYTIGKYALVSK